MVEKETISETKKELMDKYVDLTNQKMDVGELIENLKNILKYSNVMTDDDIALINDTLEKYKYRLKAVEDGIDAIEEMF